MDRILFVLSREVADIRYGSHYIDKCIHYYSLSLSTLYIILLSFPFLPKQVEFCVCVFT